MSYHDDDVDQSGGLYRGLRMARRNPEMAVDEFFAREDGRILNPEGLNPETSAYRRMVRNAHDERVLAEVAYDWRKRHGRAAQSMIPMLGDMELVLRRDMKLNRMRRETVHAVKDPWTCARGLDAMLAAMNREQLRVLNPWRES